MHPAPQSGLDSRNAQAFLSILANLPHLQMLELGCALPHVDFNAPAPENLPTFGQGIFHLSNLRSLSLVGDSCPEIAHFLHQLRLPPSTHIRLLPSIYSLRRIRGASGGPDDDLFVKLCKGVVRFCLCGSSAASDSNLVSSTKSNLATMKLHNARTKSHPFNKTYMNSWLPLPSQAAAAASHSPPSTPCLSVTCCNSEGAACDFWLALGLCHNFFNDDEHDAIDETIMDPKPPLENIVQWSLNARPSLIMSDRMWKSPALEDILLESLNTQAPRCFLVSSLLGIGRAL